MTSPQPPDPAAAVDAAQTLAAALETMAGQLKTVNDNSEERDAGLEKYGRANRHRIWLSYSLVAVDVLLTVVVGLFAVQAHNASTTATQTRVSSIAACQSTNVARAENEQLWDFVLALIAPKADETGAEKAAGEKVLADLRAHVVHAFMPRNCTQLYATGGDHG
jgi:hypothetical protein